MDRGNILSGAAFSAVLMSAVAFLVVLTTIGMMANGYIKRSLTDEAREDVRARWELFANDYRDEGLDPLVDLITSATKFNTDGQRAIGLFDRAGERIAGNVVTRPAAAGWSNGPLVVSARGQVVEQHPVSFVFRAGQLDGYTLVIGQRLDQISRTNLVLFRALAVAGLVVVLTMLGAGYFFSSKSQRKLEGLETTLARVAEGDTTARIELSPDNDQIDRIAGRMNAHLDMLSRLTISTRSTAAAIAHDLKSPLARAYMGLGRALARVEAGDDPRTEIEDTQADLETMNGIFDSFLRLSRIEAGADGADFTNVALGPLLDDLAETYQMVAEDNGQELIYERPEEDAFDISGDAALLQQMVVNLLQNAVTHGSDGNKIRLGLGRVDGRIHLTVSDSGPGIPEAARNAVFEPFHRLDPSRNRPGSGLGLALVRAIADRHRAHITLSDNAPGLRVVVAFAAVMAGREPERPA